MYHKRWRSPAAEIHRVHWMKNRIGKRRREDVRRQKEWIDERGSTVSGTGVSDTDGTKRTLSSGRVSARAGKRRRMLIVRSEPPRRSARAHCPRQFSYPMVTELVLEDEAIDRLEQLRVRGRLYLPWY